VLRLENKLDEAGKEALKALTLAPNDVAAHNNYANLLMAVDKYDEAAKHYKKAIELNPENAKPYYNLACLYSLQDHKREAMKYLREALQRSPALRADAANDPDLKALRKDADFRRLVYSEPEKSPAPEEKGTVDSQK
jgi:Flp pilus assembly protein TadD